MNYVALQAFAIVVGLLASGAAFGMTFLAIPPLLRTYSVANKAAQVKYLWRLGQKAFPLTFICTGLIHFWLAAYGTTQSVYELTAGVLTFGIAPFSIIFIRATDHALLSFAEVSEKHEESASSDLCDDQSLDELAWRWGVWNAVRAAMPLSGALFSVYGLLSLNSVVR